MTAQSNLNSWRFTHILCLISNIIGFLEIYKALVYFLSKLLGWQILLSLLYRLEDICLMDGIGVLLKVVWKVVGHQAGWSPTECSLSSVSWSSVFCIAHITSRKLSFREWEEKLWGINCSSSLIFAGRSVF